MNQWLIALITLSAVWSTHAQSSTPTFDSSAKYYDYDIPNPSLPQIPGSQVYSASLPLIPEKAYEEEEYFSPGTSASPLEPVGDQRLAHMKIHAQYASIAYCVKPHTDFSSCGERCAQPSVAGTIMLNTFNSTGLVMAYLAAHPTRKELIVGLTGSASNDLLFRKDTKIIMEDAPSPAPPGCKVHRGFNGVYEPLRLPLRQEVEKALRGQYAGWKVVITGQSLGGGTMVYAAVDFATHIPSDLLPRHHLIGYGFGTPRVGNTRYAAWVNSLHLRILRITNPLDPITRGLIRESGYASPHREVLTEGNDLDSKARYCDANAIFGEDSRCSVGYRIASPDFMTHHNHYFGIFFGVTCTAKAPTLKGILGLESGGPLKKAKESTTAMVEDAKDKTTTLTERVLEGTSGVSQRIKSGFKDRFEQFSNGGA
ncbi:MAG: Alpha/Beta hydrolase protein [Piptocephalis tieghemiana]|nr:MAG: Alpha/Beta hydrolase protein [Piptocephalis tieghemiana]